MKFKIPRHGVVPIAILAEKDLTLADLRVYITLSMFQGHNEAAYPSRDEIALQACLSETTVSHSVAHLIDLGWIQRDQRGRGLKNIYRVFWEDEQISDVLQETHQEKSSCVPESTPDVLQETHPSIKQKPHFKTPKTSTLKTVDPLYKPIEQAFLSQGNFADYRKEGSCIKAIIKKVRNLTPDEADITALKLLETFKVLTSGNDKFWKDRPFLPSGLSPCLEQVWTIAKKGSAAPSMDWFDELERRKA